MINESNSYNSIDGLFTINSEAYSARDVIQSLLSQGILIKQIGSNLRLGNELISPMAVNQISSSSGIDKSVVNGLEIQISRIFSEITKLKQQLEVKETHASINTGQSNSNSNSKSELFKKWDIDKKSSSFQNQQNVPIITLGKNTKSSKNFTTARKSSGLSREKVIEEFSSQLVSKTNRVLNSISTNDSRFASLTSHHAHSELEPQNQQINFELKNHENKINSETPFDGRCGCGMVIPPNAKFCARCGKRIMNI